VGLTAEQRRFYDDNGYLLIEGAVGRDDLAAIRATLPETFAEDSPRRVLEKDGRTVRTVFASHTVNDVFAGLVRHPGLLGPARDLLGGDVHAYQFKINVKAAFSGDVWAWHQDFIFWHHEDGLPEPRILTCSLFLDDVTEFNGPLAFIPGSHREGMIDAGVTGEPDGFQDSPAWMSTLTADLKYSLTPPVVARLVSKYGMVAPKGPAGSALIFHPNLAHGSSTNMSPFARNLLLITYNRADNRLREVANPRPDWLASRDYTPLGGQDEPSRAGAAR